MHITDLKAMEAFSSKLAAPSTSLALSLTHAASPSPFMKEISPSQAAHAGSPLLLGFNHNTNIPVGSLLNFLNPSLNPSTLPSNKLQLHDHDMHMHMHASPRPPPPVQLELLPLAPSPHKLSLSPPPPPLHWPLQPPALPPSSPTSSHFPSISMRGIDVNQLPAAYTDRDEISESSGFLMMKREREERSSDAELERTCEVSSRGSDEEGEGGGSARKKLRLSKEQSTLLEESFKEHSTLNPKQKAELARQLSLRPRQVEVWFQNRRARTKLKQTEVDCELLKRCCETLTEENRRLHKEVQELRAMKVAPPCVISHDRFMPMPAATLSICPSCERVASHVAPLKAPGGAASQLSTPSSTLSFSLSPTPPSRQLHHPHHLPLAFPSPPPSQQHALPSAAC